MKNTKISRILVIVLSLVLLLGATVGIMASAEEDNAVGIKAASVIHNDKVALVFAIDVSNDAIPQDLKVEYKWGTDGEWKPAGKRAEVYNVYDDEGVEIISTHPLYATNGVAAQDYTDVVYVRAYTGETASESKMVSFSVMEFLYTKLYKDNYVSYWNNAIQTFADKELYLSMVKYGEKAQIAIDKWRGEEDITGKLITDYHIITIVNDAGTIDDTDKSTVVSTQPQVTLNYSGSLSAGQVCVWNVTTWDNDENKTSTTVEDGMAVSVTGHMVCTANIYTPSTYVKGSGYYYTATGETIEDENGDEITLPNIPGDRKDYQSSQSALISGEVKNEDGDYYEYMKYTSQGSTFFTTSAEPADGTKTNVFEFDAKIDNPGTSLGTIGLYDRINGYRGNIYLQLNSDGKIAINSSHATNILDGELAVTSGEWHNWRFEFAYSSASEAIVANIFIDNVYQCAFKVMEGANDNVTNYACRFIRLRPNNMELSIDNIYLGYVTDEFVVGNPAQ